jgi:RNA polymerase sigma factor (sigma-70 family)
MARGDREAFRTYYDAHFELMLVESKRCLGRDEQTCLDIVHDAMLKAIRAIKPLANRGSTAAWSRLLVRSVAYDWLRRNRRQRELTHEADDTLNLIDRGERRPFPEIDDQARMLWIEENLRRLPADVQRMVDWRYRLGWTLERIGRQMGLKPGAVDGRLRRAIDELKVLAEVWRDE